MPGTFPSVKSIRFDPCCRGARTRTSAGPAFKDAGFTIMSMPTEQQNMSRFSTLTFLNSSDHGTLSRRLEPTLLICGLKNVSSVLYNSLKRQEPTRLSQSQSPSPFCAEINRKVGRQKFFLQRGSKIWVDPSRSVTLD
jgi:hypothetical protein